MENVQNECPALCRCSRFCLWVLGAAISQQANDDNNDDDKVRTYGCR